MFPIFADEQRSTTNMYGQELNPRFTKHHSLALSPLVKKTLKILAWKRLIHINSPVIIKIAFLNPSFIYFTTSWFWLRKLQLQSEIHVTGCE